MTSKVLSMVMAMALRRARRDRGRVWWIILALAWLIQRGERRAPSTKNYRVRRGHKLDIRVAEGEQ